MIKRCLEVELGHCPNCVGERRTHCDLRNNTGPGKGQTGFPRSANLYPIAKTSGRSLWPSAQTCLSVQVPCLLG